MLNKKRVNKGIKRTNSLPLSPVVLTRPYYRKNRYLQVLPSSAKLEPRLLRALQFFFALCIKFDKGGNFRDSSEYSDCVQNVW